MFRQEVTKLEIDVLFVFYTFSNQFGVVDVSAARAYAAETLGVAIPDQPFTIMQKHYDTLMDAGAIPDIRPALTKAIKSPRTNRRREAPPPKNQ